MYKLVVLATFLGVAMCLDPYLQNPFLRPDKVSNVKPTDMKLQSDIKVPDTLIKDPIWGYPGMYPYYYPYYQNYAYPYSYLYSYPYSYPSYPSIPLEYSRLVYPTLKLSPQD